MHFIEFMFVNLKISAVICLLAYILTKFKSFKRAVIMIPEKYDIYFLSIFFGFISIIGSFLGVDIFNGIKLQSSIIGPIVGGIIAGPFVGIISGLIGSLFWIQNNSFIHIPMFYTTIIAGITGSIFYKVFTKERLSTKKAFTATFIVELISIILILLLAKPTILSEMVVKMISPVTAFVNPIGAALFIGIIKDIETSLDSIGANYAEKALEIAKQTLPIVENGFNQETAQKIGKIIYKYANVDAVAITDTKNLISFKGIGEDHHIPGNPISTLSTQNILNIKGVLNSQVLITNNRKEIGCYSENCPLDAVVAAPIICDKELLGYIKLYRVKTDINSSDIKMATGIANLLSLQLQTVKLNEQSKLLSRAEYSALKAQVNPHFLFNTLSVIKWLVTTNPNYAKDTIVRLASFYRKVLKRSSDMIPFSEELEAVTLYIDLQKARFADRLEIVMDIKEECLSELFPSFILEPIVENAIKHGFSKEIQKFKVQIQAFLENNYMHLIVFDSGLGFPQEIIDAVENNIVKDSMGIGLTNINRRLKNLYGNNYIFKLENTSKGTIVNIGVPINQEVF